MDKLMAECRAISAALHSWRPDSEFDYLWNVMLAENTPFCMTCGDWHMRDEDHSATDKDA